MFGVVCLTLVLLLGITFRQFWSCETVPLTSIVKPEPEGAGTFGPATRIYADRNSIQTLKTGLSAVFQIWWFCCGPPAQGLICGFAPGWSTNVDPSKTLSLLAWYPCPSCPGYYVMTVLSWLSSHDCPVETFLLRISFHGCPFGAFLVWLSGNDCPCVLSWRGFLEVVHLSWFSVALCVISLPLWLSHRT